ncbi:unnamed protein product [Camellia sinensis]
MGDDGVEPRAPVNEGSQTSTTIVGVLRFSIDSRYQQTKFSGSMFLWFFVSLFLWFYVSLRISSKLCIVLLV